tara:strand:- start:408 stop:581 length:174 start_codon:yes stop_codon:yes gene_type:complete
MPGTYMQSAKALQNINGTMDSNGMPSVGNQQLAQEVMQNEKTSATKRAESFLNRMRG